MLLHTTNRILRSNRKVLRRRDHHHANRPIHTKRATSHDTTRPNRATHHKLPLLLTILINHPIRHVNLCPTHLRHLTQQAQANNRPHNRRHLIRSRLDERPTQYNTRTLMRRRVQTISQRLLRTITIRQAMQQIYRTSRQLSDPRHTRAQRRRPHATNSRPILQRPMLQRLPTIRRRLRRSTNSRHNVPLNQRHGTRRTAL